MRWTFAQAALGATLGLMTAMVWPIRSGQVEPVRAPEAAPEVGIEASACDARILELERDLQSLEPQLETAVALIAVHRVRKEQREGVAQPWPADAAPWVRETSLRSAVQEATEASGFELRAIDCQEFPCTVTVTLAADPDPDRGSSLRDAQPFLDALPTSVEVPEPVSARALFRKSDGTYIVTLAWADRPLDGEDAERRLQWRVRTQHAHVTQ